MPKRKSIFAASHWLWAVFDSSWHHPYHARAPQAASELALLAKLTGLTSLTLGRTLSASKNSNFAFPPDLSALTNLQELSLSNGLEVGPATDLP